jgi:hypothetical protein
MAREMTYIILVINSLKNDTVLKNVGQKIDQEST